MPAWMSESKPPHLPSTRTGRILTPKAVPAMPWPLFAAAPIRPAILVPCQELSSTPQFLNCPLAFSPAVIQSPGSLASASRPSPSLAVPASDTMS